MATHAGTNVKLIKLAISVASVAAIAGITGRMAADQAPGSAGGHVADSVTREGPGPKRFSRQPLRSDLWDGGRHQNWDDDPNGYWDGDDADGEEGDHGARLWFEPRGTDADNQTPRPPRTRTRHS